MAFTALPDLVEAPSIGAQTRLYLGIITDPDTIPHSGVPDVTSTPASGVTALALLGGDYAPLGCTKTLKVKLPTSKMHNIPCGLEVARWQTPGMRQLGSLDVSTLDFAGEQYDILQYANQRTVAALVTEDFDGTIQRVIYCVDWMPELDIDIPEGEGDASVTGTGPFSRAVIDHGGDDTIEHDLG